MSPKLSSQPTPIDPLPFALPYLSWTSGCRPFRPGTTGSGRTCVSVPVNKSGTIAAEPTPNVPLLPPAPAAVWASALEPDVVYWLSADALKPTSSAAIASQRREGTSLSVMVALLFLCIGRQRCYRQTLFVQVCPVGQVPQDSIPPQ